MWRTTTSARWETSLLGRTPDYFWPFQPPLNLHLVVFYLYPCLSTWSEQLFLGMHRWPAVMLRENHPQLEEPFILLGDFALNHPPSQVMLGASFSGGALKLQWFYSPGGEWDTPERYLHGTGGVICGHRTLTQGIKWKREVFPFHGSALHGSTILALVIVCSTIGAIQV